MTEIDLEAHGWNFVPSHDMPSAQGFYQQAVPESYVHEDGRVVWDYKEVLSIITKERGNQHV